MQSLLIRLVDSIREYEHESGHSIYDDERESVEFVNIFLRSESLKRENCEHPRHKRNYIGSGFIRCSVCGLEFK